MNVGLNNFINKASSLSFSSKATIPLRCLADSGKDVFIKSAQKTKEISDSVKVQSQIPEFLYHLTNKSNFNKIVESGEIKPSKDIIDGVFMFDMADFQKNWIGCKYSSTPQPISLSLLLQAIKYDDGLVLLKIPTEKLDTAKIRIRPQDEVCSYINSDKFRKLCMAYAESGGPFQHKYEFPKELVEGYDTSRIREFFDEGRPIEYVYEKPIKLAPAELDTVLKVSNVNYGSLLKAKEDEISNIFAIFGDLASK